MNDRRLNKLLNNNNLRYQHNSNYNLPSPDRTQSIGLSPSINPTQSNLNTNQLKQRKNLKVQNKLEQLTKLVAESETQDDRTQGADTFFTPSYLPTIVIDILRVAHNLSLRKETAFLAISYLATINSRLIHNVNKAKRDIISIAAILIAIKIEEIELRKIQDIVLAFDCGRIKVRDVIHAEFQIITTMDWKMHPDTLFNHTNELLYKFTLFLNSQKIKIKDKKDIEFVVWILLSSLIKVISEKLINFRVVSAAVFFVSVSIVEQSSGIKDLENIALIDIVNLLKERLAKKETRSFSKQHLISFLVEKVDINLKDFMECTKLLLNMIKSNSYALHVIFKHYNPQVKPKLSFFDPWMEKIHFDSQI